MAHCNTLKCVRAENHIAELGIQLMVLKGKMRKKNIKIQELEVENKKLRTTIKQLEIVLGKLSRLGNEPLLGNSDGNVMAQEALKQLEVV